MDIALTAPTHYEVGQVLALNVEPGTDNGLCKVIKVKIKRMQTKWTLSCGLIVEVLEPHLLEGFTSANSDQHPIAFLKLYDRRYAEQLRDILRRTHPRWDERLEKSCVELVKTGKVDQFIHRLRQKDTSDEEKETWNVEHHEISVACEIRAEYLAEIAAYRRLQNYQGHLVPRLFATVNLDLTPSDIEPTWITETIFHVKGILIEYIDGFSLNTLVQTAPRSAWQDIVDQALQAVFALDSEDVLNRDVRQENFMVKPQPDKTYQVFMIDLGQCLIRGEHESDLDWKSMKNRFDEEGAVGVVMMSTLKRSYFELNFVHSLKYLGYLKVDDNVETTGMNHQEDSLLELDVNPQ